MTSSLAFRPRLAIALTLAAAASWLLPTMLRAAASPPPRPSTGPSKATDSRLFTLQVGRLTRTAVVFAPAKRSRGGAPLVIVFHGHSGNGADFAAKSQLAAAWPEAQMVFPDGLDTPSPGDPEGDEPGWQHDVGDENDRDLKFFDALLERFADPRKGGSRKVYVAGFSNGARFTYVLWSARSKDIAAVAASAGNCTNLCESLQPKPAVLIYGTADERCKYPSAVKTIDGVLHANQSKVGPASARAQGALQVEASEPGLTGWPIRPNAGLFPAGVGGADTLVIIHPQGHSWQDGYNPEVVKFLREH